MVRKKLATVGGVTKLQKGPVIAIMCQYAYLGTGKTIHSFGQLEINGIKVNDTSIKVGDEQRIDNPDGYVIPIDILIGLPYIPIRPYTYSEWHRLPNVIIISDVP